MNANEVIVALQARGSPEPLRQHGLELERRVPSAVHLAALDVAQNELLPALKELSAPWHARPKVFRNVVNSGRTHLMDAVPVTLGQELAGYAAQIALGQERVRSALVHVGQIPLGGTATGTGLNTDRGSPRAARAPAQRVGAAPDRAARRSVRGAGRPRRARGALRSLKVLVVSLTKIAGDLALTGSGPRAGIGDILLPELQKGSTIMPGKVNP